MNQRTIRLGQTTCNSSYRPPTHTHTYTHRHMTDYSTWTSKVIGR